MRCTCTWEDKPSRHVSGLKPDHGALREPMNRDDMQIPRRNLFAPRQQWATILPVQKSVYGHLCILPDLQDPSCCNDDKDALDDDPCSRLRSRRSALVLQHDHCPTCVAEAEQQRLSVAARANSVWDRNMRTSFLTYIERSLILLFSNGKKNSLTFHFPGFPHVYDTFFLIPWNLIWTFYHQPFWK